MTQEEKIKELEQRIAMMDADNSALCVDLAHWKKVVAGLKGHNKQLANEVKKWKAYGHEADLLIEKRITVIEEKDRVISGLNSQVVDLSAKANRACDTLKQRHEEISVLKEQVTMLKRPWWRKIF